MLDNLQLIGTGFAVVLLVLLLIWAASAALGQVFARAARATPPAPAAPPPVAPGVPPHHVAAIAAAVAQTLGPGVRVRRITAPPHRVDGWPLEGRIESYTAHRIRTDWGPTRPTLGGETPNILRGQHR